MEVVKNITEELNYIVRKATVNDEKAIYNLLEPHAKSGVVIPRSETEIFSGLRDFTVYEVGGELIGVSALHIWQQNMVEIRSLVVKSGYERQGIGSLLVKSSVEEARELGAKYIFALTYGVDFFKSLDFKVIDKDTLPEKIWGDCMGCAKFSDCDETAMIIILQE